MNCTEPPGFLQIEDGRVILHHQIRNQLRKSPYVYDITLSCPAGIEKKLHSHPLIEIDRVVVDIFHVGIAEKATKGKNVEAEQRAVEQDILKDVLKEFWKFITFEWKLSMSRPVVNLE